MSKPMMSSPQLETGLERLSGHAGGEGLLEVVAVGNRDAEVGRAVGPPGDRLGPGVAVGVPERVALDLAITPGVVA